MISDHLNRMELSKSIGSSFEWKSFKDDVNELIRLSESGDNLINDSLNEVAKLKLARGKLMAKARYQKSVILHLKSEIKRKNEIIKNRKGV